MDYIAAKKMRFNLAAASNQEFAKLTGLNQAKIRQELGEVVSSQENRVYRSPETPIPDFVFLGGTTHGYDWRKDIEYEFNIDAFNPIVDEWTEECKVLEDRAKETALFQLYAITPFAKGVFSIAELTEAAITHPAGTVVVFLDECDGKTWSEHQQRSNAAVLALVGKHGATVLNSLDAAVDHINKAVTAIQQYEATAVTVEQHFAGAASVSISQNALTRYGNDSAADAIRWIEAHKTLDSLGIVFEVMGSRGDLTELELNALKRLLRNSLLVIGFYVDELDYALDLKALGESLAKAKDEVHARVLNTWKPGMSGYNIQ